MRAIIQKLQKLGFTKSLLIAVLLPLIAASVVSAAAKPGTCILADNQGQSVQQVKPCTSFLPSGTDANGTKLDSTKCYELNETRGAITISQTLSCSNSRLSGAAQVICGNGSPAPNNDKSQCTATTGMTNYCPNGTEAPNNNLSKCTSTTVPDPAVQGGNCSDVGKCDLIQQYINPLINFLVALVGIAVVISIIVGGIQYSSSAGDPAKVSAAKNRIRNAIIALVTFLFLYALLNFLIPGGLL